MALQKVYDYFRNYDKKISECLMKQIEELEERKNKKIRGEDKN